MMTDLAFIEFHGAPIRKLVGRNPQREKYVRDRFISADIELSQLTHPHECYTLVDGQAMEIPEAVAAHLAAQERKADRTTIEQDNTVKQLLNASPTQIANYINNYVTDLASAKVVLTKLALALSYSLREEFKDD